MKFLVFLLFFITIIPAMAQHSTGTQDTEGYTTSQVLEQEKVVPLTINQNSILRVEPAPIGQKAVGVNMSFSSKNTLVTIPGSYQLTDKVEVGASIPLVRKKREAALSNEELSETAIGDVSIYGLYSYEHPKFFLKSKLIIKTPTGNGKYIKDGEEKIPTGTGAFDIVIDEFFIYRDTVDRAYRFFGGFVFRFNGDYDYTENYSGVGYTDQYSIDVEYGNSFNLYLGGQYLLPYYTGLWAYGAIRYLSISEGKQKIALNAGAPTESDSNDSMKALDLTLGGKYEVMENIALKLGLTIPVSTSYDEDISDPKKRQLVVDIGMDYIW